MIMEDFKDDTTSRRSYVMENGNELLAERKDPYGFIEIRFKKGSIPECLSGQYTSYDQADKVIKWYLNAKNKFLATAVDNTPLPKKVEAVA